MQPDLNVTPNITRKTLILTGNFATQERILGSTVAKDVKHLISKVYFKIPYNEIAKFAKEVINLGYTVDCVFLLDELLSIVEDYCNKKQIENPNLLTVESILEWIFFQKGTVLSIEKTEQGNRVQKPQYIKLKVKLVWDMLGLNIQYDKVDLIPKNCLGYWKHILAYCSYDYCNYDPKSKSDWKVYNSFVFSCMYLDVLTQIEVQTDWDNKTYPTNDSLVLPVLNKEEGQDRQSHKLRSVTSKGLGKKARKKGGAKEQAQTSIKITTGRAEYPLWYATCNIPKIGLPKGIKSVIGKLFFYKEGIQYDVGYIAVKRSKKTKLDYLYFYVNDRLRNTNTREVEREVTRLQYLISQTEDKDEQRELRYKIFLATFNIPLSVVIALKGLGLDLKGNPVNMSSPLDWGKHSHCLMVHPKFPVTKHSNIEAYNQYVGLYNEHISLPKIKFSTGEERDGWADKPIIVITY